MTEYTPGFYDNMPEPVYHADPCPEPSLSSSIAKLLINRTPLHAWCAHPQLNPDHEAEQKSEFDLGRAAHALLLGTPSDFVVIDADSYRSKAAQQQRDDAYAAGKTPLLADKHERVMNMVAAAKQQLAHHDDGRYMLDGDGASEVTAIWREGEAWCRARADRIAGGDEIIFDYKTTGGSAHPDQWGAVTAWQAGYDVQAAFYRRGWHALIGRKPAFVLVVQETEPPYALSVQQFSGDALAVGEAKVEHAIQLWTLCMESNHWPAYPNKTCVISPPWRHASEWIDEDTGGPRSTAREDLLRSMSEWQAP